MQCKDYLGANSPHRLKDYLKKGKRIQKFGLQGQFWLSSLKGLSKEGRAEHLILSAHAHIVPWGHFTDQNEAVPVPTMIRWEMNCE